MATDWQESIWSNINKRVWLYLFKRLAKANLITKLVSRQTYRVMSWQTYKYKMLDIQQKLESMAIIKSYKEM